MRRLELAVLVFLCFLMASSSCLAREEIQVESFTHNNVHYSFSNAALILYRNNPAFSVDVEIEVQTTFRPRDVPIARLQLSYFGLDLAAEKHSRPVMLNSSTFGTILYLHPETATITGEEEAPGPVGSIAMESGAIHRGTLLFALSPVFSMIHSISLEDTTGTIRKPWNEHIDLPPMEMDWNTIRRILVQTEIPARGHMMLLEILQKMKEFTTLNAPLQDAW